MNDPADAIQTRAFAGLGMMSDNMLSIGTDFF